MLVRALTAFLVLPGMFGVLVPPLIARADPFRGQTWPPGLVILLGGAVIVVWCVRDFFVTGRGTLAPWDPPKQLVVVGLYRYLRNPMYVGVLMLVAGWAIVLASPLVMIYAVVLFIAFHLRVLWSEEPYLEAQFGEPWRVYRNAVRRWWPRSRPFRDG